MSKTNYAEDAWLNHALRNVAHTSPTSVHLALFTADPTETGSQASEVTGGSYSREPITFAAPSGGSCLNTGIITFTQATAAWGTVTHFGVMDASSSGNMLYSDALDSSQQIDIGGTATVADGALSVT